MKKLSKKLENHIDQIAADLREYLRVVTGDAPHLWALYSREEYTQSSLLIARKIIQHRVVSAHDPVLAIRKAMRHCRLSMYSLQFPLTRHELFKYVGTFVSNHSVRLALLNALAKL